MKHKAKTALLMVCILLAAICSVGAEVSSPKYAVIGTLVCSLRITSGTATCVASVTTSSSTCTSHLSASLKRSTNGINWTAVDSWTANGSGYIGTTIDESITVSSGYKYKLFVTATIKNQNNVVIETATKNSSVQEY